MPYMYCNHTGCKETVKLPTKYCSHHLEVTIDTTKVLEDMKTKTKKTTK